MSQKLKGEMLYQKMRAERERLVKKYEAAGTIRYDEAIGLIPVGGNPAQSTAATTLGGSQVVNTGRREKRVPDHREDGVVAATNGRVVLDLDAIKTANLALPGAVTGSMMEALKIRAEGKTILLFANDAALRYGTVILGEVKCQLKLQGDIVNAIRLGIFPTFQTANTTLNGVLNTGLIHALPGNIEQESLSHRGLFKPANYRGDVEYLKDPTSIWSTVDASLQPFMALGVNSEIRMWGEEQVIDLCGFRIGAHERPNRIAPFNSIIDLSDGHFSGLSTKGARKAHIYSSSGVGRLARNNHFSIRGHFVKDLLVEGVVSGDAATLNQGAYFGTAIFNDSERIVFKDVHQEMLNKAVANSSMELSHYAQLFNIETLFGWFERPSTWETNKTAYPWMKWELLASGATDTFGNGKTTRLPVFKTAAELEAAGVTAGKGATVLAALNAAKEAYKKSMKSADDTYIQVNTGHNSLNVVGANRSGLPMDSLQRMTDVKQIPRSTNLTAQNPRNSEGFRYPDSVSYGFRIGSASEGVGALADTRAGTVQDVYIMDCTFAGMHLSPMETVAISAPGKGFNKTFNGNGLRPFGYTNSNSDAASMAPASILLSKEAMQEAIPELVAVDSPVKSFDTALKATQNTSQTGWTAKKAHGLYKGNDVVEASLAAIEAIGLLKKYFTAAAPTAVLSGLDNSNIDIGILALRKSMMDAIDASTACHVGLKGGFQGDIFADDGTYYGYGEIYPWFVKKDGSVSVDKDKILEQAAARTDRRQTTSYLAVEIPQCSDSVFKLKQVSSDTVALVKADSETPVTYEECVTLLGFGSGTGPVTYKMTRNLDGQHHVHKGVFGVRLDQTSGFAIQNVVIKDLETTDAKQPAKGSTLGSVAQQISSGVQAADETESGVLKARGVSINGCVDGSIDNVYVAKSAAGGDITGVEIRGRSSDIKLESIKAEELEGHEKSVGLRVSKTCSDIEVSKMSASDMSISESAGSALPIEIQSTDVKLK